MSSLFSERESASALPPAYQFRDEDGEALWSGLASAADSARLCHCWLGLQCHLVQGTQAGLLLLKNEAGDSYVPAAVWPVPQRDLAFLAAPAQEALAERTGVVRQVAATADKQATVHIAYPIESDGDLFGVVAIEITPRSEVELRAALRQLVWGGAWLDGLCLRRNATAMRSSSQRSVLALDVLAAVQEQDGLQHASLALVNELVTRLPVDRASLGLMRGAQLEVQAISRSAWFERKSQLVVALGNAMDEALDQRTTVCEPPLPERNGCIAVAQRDLSTRTGNASVCAVPLLISGKPVGVILFERVATPYTAAEVATFEALAALVAPALDARLALDRWVAGRLLDRATAWRNKLFGARHPGLKMGVAVALLLALFLVFAEGDFRVSAKAVVEGAVQRAAVAPFEGFIAEAPVRAGDTVRAGQLLARLEDRDLRLERVKLVAEREQQLRKYHDALAKHDRPAAGIQMAQAGQSAAQIALVDEKIARTRVTSPSDGVVVSGDLSQLLGSPVEQGKLLFEIAPLDAYRIILKVDDRDIAFVVNGQHGRLVLAGLGGDPLRFQVTKVTSVATPQEGHNYFRVEAQLETPRIGVRPGMEGVGKIIVDHRKLAWIWTRGLIDWMRITFWTWMP